MEEVVRFIVHYGLHFVFPFALAWRFSPQKVVRTYLILLSTMIVDIDHLWAQPIFDPCRCSIGFHPLHSYWAIVIYLILLFPVTTRWWGVGLVLHMITDLQDCWWSC